MLPNDKIKNYALLHLIVFIWGFTAILGALISIDAVPLVFYRMALASIFIFIYFIIYKKSFTIDAKTILQFFLTGTIIAAHWIFFFLAIKVSTISVALVTMSTGAFFTSLLEPLFFKRKIKLIELFFGLCVVIGLYIIFNFESQYQLGIFYALFSSFLSALFAVLNGIFVKKHSPNKISFYQLSFGAIVVGIYLLFTNIQAFNIVNIEFLDWIYLAILSSVCTAFAFIASVKVMQFLSPFTVMLTINLEPIYAIILALIIFGDKEKMNTEFYIGAAIVLFVVLLNGVVKNRKYLQTKFKLKISQS